MIGKSFSRTTARLTALPAADPRFKVVHLRRNFGQTAALMAALDHSIGDIVIMIDADLQNDPSDIERLLAKMAEGYDVVSGWRQSRDGSRWSRRWPSQLAKALISRMSGVRLHDLVVTACTTHQAPIGVRLNGEMGQPLE
jgi:dolichol-phosphate mannosyltransferase